MTTNNFQHLVLYSQDTPILEAGKIGLKALQAAKEQLEFILKLIQESDIKDSERIIHILSSAENLPKQIVVKLSRVISTKNCIEGSEAIQREIDFLSRIDSLFETVISGVSYLSRREQSSSLNMWALLDFLRRSVEAAQPTGEVVVQMLPIVKICLISDPIYTLVSDGNILLAQNQRLDALEQLADLAEQIIKNSEVKATAEFSINGVAFTPEGSSTNSTQGKSLFTVDIGPNISPIYFSSATSAKIDYSLAKLDLEFFFPDGTKSENNFSSFGWLDPVLFGQYVGQRSSDLSSEVNSALRAFSTNSQLFRESLYFGTYSLRSYPVLQALILKILQTANLPSDLSTQTLQEEEIKDIERYLKEQGIVIPPELIEFVKTYIDNSGASNPQEEMFVAIVLIIVIKLAYEYSQQFLSSQNLGGAQVGNNF